MVLKWGEAKAKSESSEEESGPFHRSPTRASLMSVELEAGIEESLEMMQWWAKEEECGALSVSESGPGAGVRAKWRKAWANI